MSRRYFGLAGLAVVLCLASAAAVAAEPAGLGDRAPGLDVEIVQGRPVTVGASPQVVVVEFWATWCGPCKQTIPHLSRIQEKYRDAGLRVIGVSGEDRATVAPFVNEMGDKMNYTVAVDNNFETGRRYMAAFGVNSIPHAFIIDQAGNFAWHGHPAAREFEAKLVELLKPGGKRTKPSAKQDSQGLTKDQIDALLRQRRTGEEGNPPPPGPRDSKPEADKQSGEFVVINQTGVSEAPEEIEGFSWTEAAPEPPNEDSE